MNNYYKRAPVVVNPVIQNPNELRMSISGNWKFKLDPMDVGIKEKWYRNLNILTEKIKVPGSWQGQGFGSDENDSVWDFRISARVFKATYKGTGWYGKSFIIPSLWEGKKIWINFGGIHPSAEIWLNGDKIGDNHAPFVPFSFDVSSIVKFSDENVLIVRVSEKARIFGLAYNWQGNWSGIYRDIEITATGKCYIDYLRLYPNVDNEQMMIKTKIDGIDGNDKSYLLKINIYENNSENLVAVKKIEVNSKYIEFNIQLSSPMLWSPDSPSLYRVDTILYSNGNIVDAISHRTGFVKLDTKNKHFLINNEPYYMKGTGDFLSNPETGCPDTNRDRWRKKLKTLRDYGYNYVRLQSYVYGPEYYEAADDVGLLIQSEMGMLGGWGGVSQWHAYQWPQPTAENRDLLKWQWDSIVKRDVNNPSANIYCMSNEYRKETDYPRIAWQCYYDTKAIKPTSLVIWTDGGHNENLPEDFVNEQAELDNICKKPLIQHEFKWWSSLPDVRLICKYTGAIRPYSAILAMESAAKNGISHTLLQGAINSQKLQFIEAKGKMEACRRDNITLAGICHFNAMDTNPSPQGIIDEFYEKKYVDAKTWIQTNGDTVIMNSLNFDDRILTHKEVLKCDFWVSDFSHPPLKNPTLKWRVRTKTDIIMCGEKEYLHLPYCTCSIGQIIVNIPEVDRPVPAWIEIELNEDKIIYTNRWDIWFYPIETDLSDNAYIYGIPKYTWISKYNGIKPFDNLNINKNKAVVLTETLDDELCKYIECGGKVILAASEGMLRPIMNIKNSIGRYYFTPPANYPPYEDGHDGTIIKHHKMLGDLPHEGFADLQFYRMMCEYPALDLEPLGLNAFDPVIRVIHSYPVGRSLSYLVECSIGEGGLIITSLNLDKSLAEASYLLKQLCNYMSDDLFKPELKMTLEKLENLKKASLIP